jgi:DNA-binding NarL/FixJ family response regulator
MPIMNSAGEPIPIVIVDDDTKLCSALARLFEKDGRIKVLATTSQPNDTIPLLKKHRPRVLLLDIELHKQINGIDIIRMVREREDIDVEILVYTVYASHEIIFEALRAGANSYVWKRETTESISDSIVNTAEGKAHISPSIARMMLDHFDSYWQLLTDEQK